MPAVRSYHAKDKKACLALFDQNCPAYFAPNERTDFEEYLRDSAADYRIYEQDKQILSAFGLNIDKCRHTASLRWIMVAKNLHSKGMGTRMMQQAIADAKAQGMQTMIISASQHSEPFFTRFGAVRQRFHENGWGPGMHRVEMLLPL